MSIIRCLVGAGIAVATGGAVSPISALAAQPTHRIVHHPYRGTRAISNVGWASTNWSGYAETKGAPYTQVVANWAVPSVSATPRATYSADWVGIDGYTNSNLIQTGTESDWYSGSAHYRAWWEILPAPETVITSMTVSPGDQIHAVIAKISTTTWTITIKDTTKGSSFTTSQIYTGTGASAEWIVERPDINGQLATLAHYKSPVKFDHGQANGKNAALTASESGEMVNSAGTAVISIPSTPDSDTDGFNCSYGSTAPPPPSS